MTYSKLVANDNLKFGDVVLVRFPFTNQLMTKQRPALVVSGPTYNFRRPDVIVMAITSQMANAAEYAHAEILDWAAAGLLKASVLKPVVATIEQSLVVKCLGALSYSDMSKVERVLEVIRE